MHQTRDCSRIREQKKRKSCGLFQKHHRDLHQRVMHPIYIHPSNMQCIRKNRNVVNSSRKNSRGKLTQKLTLLTQRDNSAPKEIMLKRGTPEYPEAADTLIGPKHDMRNAPKHVVTTKTDTESGIQEP